MASIIFGRLFFPSADKDTETLLSLAAFALAFVVRPLGGIQFSHIGDRIGRKKALVMTLSLLAPSFAKEQARQLPVAAGHVHRKATIGRHRGEEGSQLRRTFRAKPGAGRAALIEPGSG